jgi:predicted nucleic acid-binding protein
VNYLVLIGQIDLVPRLLGRLSIPTVVRDELDDPMTPAALRQWIGAPPGWLSIMPAPSETDPALASLDEGERAAITLATTIKADLLLMDDRAGVAAARAQGIEVTGTLGILDRAARRFGRAPDRIGSTPGDQFSYAPGFG